MITTFPKHPALKAAGAIADHGRQATRAHARLDQVESTTSKQTSDIAAGATDLTALETRLGGDTQETYLGTLGQMSHITDGSQTSMGGWTTGGALNGGPTQYWDNSHAAALVPWMNEVYNDINTLFSLFGDLLTELQNSKYMNT